VALGYEGYIRVGGVFAMGTGSSVPRARARIDSSSGYGGEIKSPVSEMGIGAPRAYDWETHDGSVNFEVHKAFFDDPIKTWLFDRQTERTIYLLSRDGNVQQYDRAFWSSISISSAEGSAVDGSIGFVAIERTTYSYGVIGEAGYTGNDVGQGVVCAGFPTPLNGPAGANLNPVPFWDTMVSLGGVDYDFLSWSLDFSQDVVKLFASTHGGGGDPGPKEPEYLAVGPMTVTLSGTYIFQAPAADVVNGILSVSTSSLKLKSMELQSISDDVQSGDTLVPLSVEYAVYGLDQT